MKFSNSRHYITLLFIIVFVTMSISESYGIVGGEPTSPEIHASIVNVIFEKTVCTGIVVAPQVVMTADHCANRFGKPLLAAYIQSGPKTKACNIRNIVGSATEPNAISTPFNVHSPDIHLFRIDGPLCDAKQAVLSSKVLQPEDIVFEAGHGPGSPEYGHSTQAPIEIIALSEAKHHVSAPKGSIFVKSIKRFLAEGAIHYLPALPVNSGTTACPGDSGGPVFTVGDDGSMRLHGVIGVVLGHDKLGSKKCNYAYLQFFTPIAPYLDWIDSQIEEWQ